MIVSRISILKILFSIQIIILVHDVHSIILLYYILLQFLLSKENKPTLKNRNVLGSKMAGISNQKEQQQHSIEKHIAAAVVVVVQQQPPHYIIS